MVRPAFLVVDPEYPDSISARKLVLETAKFNVITAYSGEEAIETLARFRNVNAVVLNASLKGMRCSDVAKKMKSIRADVPIVVISPSGSEKCAFGDYRVSSHDPQELLDLLAKLHTEAA